MRATNGRLSLLFHRVADRLEISGGATFQVQAYRRLADRVAGMEESLHERWVAGGRLSEVPGIGKAIEAKLDALFRTGTFPLLQRLAQEVPESQLELLHIRGLGPARVRALAEHLGVRDVEQLRTAVETGQLAQVPGFAERTADRVHRSLFEYMSHRGRRLRHLCDGPMDTLLRRLSTCPAAGAVHPVGSYRRGAEDMANLDLVVVTTRPEQIAACLADLDAVEVLDETVSGGTLRDPPDALVPTGSDSGRDRGDAGRQGDAPLPSVRVRFDSGLVAVVRLCPPTIAGGAIAWHTGSRAHNARLRELASAREMSYGPTGLRAGGRPVRSRDESALYAALGLPEIPPELREDRGEIEAALDGRLPQLLRREDVQGDLHMHTRASDGSGSILDMAMAARALGHSYIAITDHTQNVRIANGLTPERAAALIDEVRRVDSQVEGIRILAGLEVDILKDGALDMPEEILSRLDVAIASIHSHFDQPLEEMTARVLKALENPHIHILAHPTGRLIGQRSPLQLDMDRLFQAALQCRVSLEINSNPERLDLDDRHCRIAARMGVPVVISTDAHSTSQLENLSRGVLQARRGGLEPKDVANTLTCGEALAVLRRRG
ncbi:MAG: PHP domain-containing protein [Deltaproteobacteria bacterium]|nr:PHP domain-containing protein [Deltaproteobacteria bacterium]